MREPLRFSWRHWWNLVLALIVAAGVGAWSFRLVDGRLVLGSVVLWLVIGFLAAPSLMREHSGFMDRQVFHDYEKARVRYRKAVDSGKATPQAYCALASLCQAEGDRTETLRLLEEAAIKRPDDPYLFLLMSRTLSALGRHGEALVAATRCTKMKVAGPLGDIALADALEAKGENVAAAAAYQRALHEDPKLVDCRLNLAGLYLARGETEASEREVREALRVAPKQPDALYWSGKVAATKGDIAAARSRFQAALATRPLDDHSLLVPYQEMVRAVSELVAAHASPVRPVEQTGAPSKPRSLGEEIR